jgi:hypothetical protein
LRDGPARRGAHRRGRTTVTLGRRRGSGGGKSVGWTPGRWGMSVRHSSVDGRDERRAGEKNSAGGRLGGGPRGVGAARGGPGVAETAQRCGVGRQRPGCGTRGRRRCCATAPGGGVGATWSSATDRWSHHSQPRLPFPIVVISLGTKVNLWWLWLGTSSVERKRS